MGQLRPCTLILTFARRGEEDVIRRALKWLRSQSPEACCIAFATPVSAPSLRDLGVQEVFVLGQGRPALQVVREVRRRRPALAAIIYSETKAGGHLKLEALALGTGPAKVFRFLAAASPLDYARGGARLSAVACPERSRREAPLRPVSRIRLLFSVLGKLCLTAAHLAAGALACGLAWCFLRAAQLLAGGRGARRS